MSFPSLGDGLRVDELLLRDPREEDVDVIAPAFADPDVGGEAGLPPFTADELRSFRTERMPQLREQGVLVPLLIEDEDGTILGGANYAYYTALRQEVELGYWLFQHARGRGIATRVVRAMARHAFANGVYRVRAVVRLTNEPSMQVLERAGFTREGTLRRYLKKGGHREDAALYALLADDER